MSKRKFATETTTRQTAMLRTAFCSVVRKALEDPNTVEVMANPDGSVWVERVGSGIQIADDQLDAAARERIIRLVASGVGDAVREAALAEEAAKAPVFFQLQSIVRPNAAQTKSPSEGAAAFDLGSELLALAGQSGVPSAFGAPTDPNLQSRKTAFASEPGNSDIYNPSRLHDPVSPYQVMAGTLIPASLITGINSDLPGTIIAQVTQPVYDTVSGNHLLIPQGSRLIGRYQSEVSFGQSRALVVWDRLIFTDGSSIQISEPGADSQGYAGLSDRTDHHWDRVFIAAGLATILGIGSEIGNDGDDDIERAIRRGTSDSINEAGQKIVDRNLGIQPTIRVRPGWPVRVIVTRDIILRPHTRSP